MNDILFTLWFFAPAAVANMSPIFANNIPKLQKFDKTLDMGKKYRGKRIFGEHKTFRGLLSGIVSGTVTIGLQIILFNSFSWAQSTAGTLVDYTNPLILFLGAVLGLGALTGDAVKSFFKRQFNVAPGRGWFPFDQTDFIFGAIAFSIPFVALPIKIYALMLLIALIFHPLLNIIGWLLKMKPRPF